MVLDLAGRGYIVFAGVRKQSDGEALKKRAANEKIANNIHVVILDVTRPDNVYSSVKTVTETLSKNKTKLVALINNAGMPFFGALEAMTSAELQNIFNVNVFGAMTLVTKFLPLLRESKGRIIMMGSVASLATIPFQGAYSASKKAMAGLTDALRTEVAPFGIAVSLIEPGMIRTGIFDKTSVPVSSSGVDNYSTIAKEIHAVSKQATNDSAIPTRFVTMATLHAVTSSYPLARYLVGWDAKMISVVKPWMPDWMFDFLMVKGFHYMYTKMEDKKAVKKD